MKFKKGIAASVAAIMLASSAMGASAEKLTFKDVKENEFYYEPLQKLVKFNIISGFEDNTFRPYEKVTRAQAASIIARAMGLDLTNVKDPGFKDVTKMNTHYAAIAKLTEIGVFNKGEKFNPQAHLTREQMAKILVEAFELQSPHLKEFNDVPKNSWSYEYIGTLGALNITVNEGEYNPSGVVARGHLVAFIERVINHKRADGKEDYWDTWVGWNPEEEARIAEQKRIEEEKKRAEAELIASIKKDIENSTSNLKSARNEVSAQLKKLNNVKPSSSDSSKLKKYKDELDDLEDELDDLEDELKELRADLSYYKKQKNNAKDDDEIKRYDDLIKEIEDEIDDIKDEIDDVEDEIDDVKDEIKDLKKKINDIEKYDKEYESERANLLKMLNTLDTAINNANKVLQNAKAANKVELDSAIRTFESEINAAKKDYDSAEAAAKESNKSSSSSSSSTSDKKLLEDAIKKLEKQYDTSEDLLDDGASLSKLKSTLKDLDKAIDAAEDALDDVKNSKENIKSLQNDLKDLIKDAKKLYDEIEDEIDYLEDKSIDDYIDELEDAIDDLEDAIIDLEDAIDDDKGVTKARNQLNKVIKDAKSVLSDAKKQKSKKLDDLIDELEDLIGEAEKLYKKTK